MSKRPKQGASDSKAENAPVNLQELLLLDCTQRVIHPDGHLLVRSSLERDLEDPKRSDMLRREGFWSLAETHRLSLVVEAEPDVQDNLDASLARVDGGVDDRASIEGRGLTGKRVRFVSHLARASRTKRKGRDGHEDALLRALEASQPGSVLGCPEVLVTGCLQKDREGDQWGSETQGGRWTHSSRSAVDERHRHRLVRSVEDVRGELVDGVRILDRG